MIRLVIQMCMMILAVKSLNLHDSFTEQFVLFLGKKLHLQTIAPKPNPKLT